MHPVNGLLGLGGRFDREYEVVLVLEVASLVRPQSGQRSRHWRRLQANGGDVDEVHCIAHVVSSSSTPRSVPSMAPTTGTSDSIVACNPSRSARRTQRTDMTCGRVAATPRANEHSCE